MIHFASKVTIRVNGEIIAEADSIDMEIDAPSGTLKTAQAWTEEVDYVECPNCLNSVELGSGLIWPEEPTEEFCNECGQDFLSLSPKE